MDDDNTIVPNDVQNDNQNNDGEMPVDNAQNDDSQGNAIPENWIKVTDGKFVCSECENESEPETNTVEGTVTADLTQIKEDLSQFPSKIIYGICPICGMEFVFRLKDDELYLEPSELEK